MPKSKTLRSRLFKQLVNFIYKTGFTRLGQKFWSKSLTVVNYHRIDDPDQLGLDSFRPNISAHPTAFAQQMDYLGRWFNVVSLKDVVKWLNGEGCLPPYAALITFDDGYLDNYTQAYPILRQCNFPAIIFLTTGHIGTDNPFFWDLVAYSFYHTGSDHVLFPNGQERTWTNTTQRDQICKELIESLKVLPDQEKQFWVNRLPEKLGVSIHQNYFRNLMINWDQVREMHKGGIEFGGHTINHPILSRISLEQALIEIEGSKTRIEKELGEPVLSFAYPNGMSHDLNGKIENLVARAGYRAAFTLQNGPSLLREVKQNPYAIRRIFISHSHTLPRFAIETCWVNRFR
jgi:peptidoglycan/xylan/chitin deacetylase (PgdA/CDA1 family)